jgi:non-ribosomal peptide synthetase-like protein
VVTPENDLATDAPTHTTTCRAADPVTSVEDALAEVLADVLHLERVPTDSHFFDDLGADSMLMAHFCARVRKRSDLPTVSMRDVYQHPTISGLAMTSVPPVPEEPDIPRQGAHRDAQDTGTRDRPASDASAEKVALVQETPRAASSTRRYRVCGAVQLLMFLGYTYVAATATAAAYTWIADGDGLVSTYLRSVAFGALTFVGLCVFPVAAKWILVGRWTATEFPVWGVDHMRLWTVRALLHTSPLALMAGNPLHVLYLRALGARIGRGAMILTRTLPVCTDLLTIGDGAVVRKDASILCYRASGGRIQIGSVTLGRDVFVGEKSVLDIDTSMGDEAQLGHASALHRGQHVPAREHWHGSPAQPTHLDYLRVEGAACSTWRRAAFAALTLLQLVLVYTPLAVGGVALLASLVPGLSQLASVETVEATSAFFYFEALVLSAALFFGSVLAGLVVVLSVPRLVDLMLKPDKVYPLYGAHYSAHRLVTRMTNVTFYTKLFGDSSYILHYLRALGYNLSLAGQTGANFGTEVAHETPYLTSVGRGTMVCDGLSVLNADYSSTSFRLSRVTIGAQNFLGNNIAFPPGARTGNNCLLATKVLVPLDGEVKEGVGLLGSPSFEIPRSVERDGRTVQPRTPEELAERLSRKNRYNLRTMGVFLLVRWLHVYLLTILSLTAFDFLAALGHVVTAVTLALGVVMSALYFVLVERALAGFRALRPQLCSIYDPYYWWHERLWKAPDGYLALFNGTPFKSVIWRLLGVQIGRRVLDDGCYLTERTLTVIGDDCTLNLGSKIQCHSLEDGSFKSDVTTLAAGCTLGVGSFVHYGVTIGEDAEIASDSFLMKGEDVPPHARWGGNPARELAGWADRRTGLAIAGAAHEPVPDGAPAR